MQAADLYVRHTAPNGDSFVQLHRVWNATLFMAALKDGARKENSKAKDGEPRMAKADLITRDEYMAALNKDSTQ